MRRLFAQFHDVTSRENSPTADRHARFCQRRSYVVAVHCSFARAGTSDSVCSAPPHVQQCATFATAPAPSRPAELRMPTNTTTLNPVEVGRLAIMQKYALRVIERRVEALTLTHDHHYSVTVTQQITLPRHLPDEKDGASLQAVLIPLGYFRKARLPDLKVFGPDGVVLPLLSRAERAKTIAVMFTSGWQSMFLTDVGDRERTPAMEVWDEVQTDIRSIVTALGGPARERVRALHAKLVQRHAASQGQVRRSIRRLLGDNAFWKELDALAESTLLIAKSPGIVGATYVFSVEYTERFNSSPRGSPLRTGPWPPCDTRSWPGWGGSLCPFSAR